MTEPELTPDYLSRIANAKLGIEKTDIALHDSNELHAAFASMLRQSKREAQFFSRNLEPRLLDHADVRDALSALARRSRFSQIQILVSEPESIMSSGHSWLDLFQRLSSHIEVRVTHDDYVQLPYQFSIFDRHGMVYRNSTAEMQGVAYFNSPQLCAEKQIFFQDVWSASRAATELRRLYI